MNSSRYCLLQSKNRLRQTISPPDIRNGAEGPVDLRLAPTEVERRPALNEHEPWRSASLVPLREDQSANGPEGEICLTMPSSLTNLDLKEGDK